MTDNLFEESNGKLRKQIYIYFVKQLGEARGDHITGEQYISLILRNEMQLNF